MSILGAVVRSKPDSRSVVAQRLNDLPGVELALDPGDGRLVIIIEDADAPAPSPDTLSAAETLTHIARWPEVLSTSLVFEYSGPHAPPPSGLPDVDFRSWRESPAGPSRTPITPDHSA